VKGLCAEDKVDFQLQLQILFSIIFAEECVGKLGLWGDAIGDFVDESGSIIMLFMKIKAGTKVPALAIIVFVLKKSPQVIIVTFQCSVFNIHMGGSVFEYLCSFREIGLGG